MSNDLLQKRGGTGRNRLMPDWMHQIYSYAAAAPAEFNKLMTTPSPSTGISPADLLINQTPLGTIRDLEGIYKNGLPQLPPTFQNAMGSDAGRAASYGMAGIAGLGALIPAMNRGGGVHPSMAPSVSDFEAAAPSAFRHQAAGAEPMDDPTLMSRMLREQAGSIGSYGKPTKFDKAHKEAQKNAALPVDQGGLGLPENNTAKDRAIAMGYYADMPLYHGTAADFENFKFFEDASKRVSGSPVGKLGVSLAESTDLANEFASRAGSEGSAVMPLLHRADKPASIALEGGETNSQIWETVLDAYKNNYDSLRFNNYTSNGLKNQSFILAKEPSNVRSRFAAFDPKKKNSSNLLAGAAPYAIPAALLPMIYEQMQAKTY